jgi:hypothetical protein
MNHFDWPITKKLYLGSSPNYKFLLEDGVPSPWMKKRRTLGKVYGRKV